MPRGWQTERGRVLIRVAVVVVGLVLVAYGLGVATWVSSSDSSTRFLDLSYGDPPYGFDDSELAEVVARPYFNGGAWVLLGVVAVLAGVALTRRTTVSFAVALVACLVAIGWTVAAIAALALVDLQFGARLPTIGSLMVAGALISLEVPNRSRVFVWVFFAGAFFAAVAAIAVWYLPVNSFDSSCSLATRNRYDNDDACADVYRRHWIVFGAFLLGASALALAGAVVERRRRGTGRSAAATAP